MLKIMLATAALAASVSPAAAQEPLYNDPQFGRQMSVAEMKRELIGNSIFWTDRDGRNVQHIASGGALRGADSKGDRYTIAWRFREYDNLFCEETGDPASSGCVQMLRRGDKVTFRRKDGLVEFTATLAKGNPFGM